MPVEIISLLVSKKVAGLGFERTPGSAVRSAVNCAMEPGGLRRNMFSHVINNGERTTSSTRE